MRYYFLFWSDLIYHYKYNMGYEKGWQSLTLFGASCVMAGHTMILLIYVYILEYYLDRVILDFLPNTLIGFLLLFILPYFIVNYMFVFYNKNYVNIEKDYPHKFGKIIKYFFMFSIAYIILPILYIILFIS